jgi:hypothetical protein
VFSGVPWDSAYNKAASALSTKVRGDLDISIDMFQWKQTLETARRILSLTQTLRQSWYNAGRRQGPHKEAANLYLEWTYGIAPTVDTLVGLLKKAQEDGLAGKALVHCRGRGCVVQSEQIKQNVATILPSTVPIVFGVQSSYRCQLDVYLKPDLTQWQKLSGYSSLNPVSWMWEMLPYSFVIDWFWNLGGFLRSMETTLIHASRFAYGNDTRSLLQRTSPITSSVVNGNISMQGLAGSHTFKGMDRFVLSSFPVPHLPSFGLEMGSRRILNAAALLTQFLPDMFSNKPGRIRNGKTIPLDRGKLKRPILYT